jgi:hypothetical protein
MPQKKPCKPFSQQEISNAQVEGKEEAIIIKDHRKRAMLTALIGSLGVVAYACEEVGISRQTHYAWLKTDIAYKDAIEQIYEATLDFAEARLFRQIKESDLRAIMFILRTRGKARGYSLFKENLAHATKEVNIIVQDQEMAEIIRLNKENP